MNTFTHVEPIDTVEAIIRDIIDAQIVGDEDKIQALIQALMEKLDTLYSERSEKHEGYIHVIRNAQAEVEALRTRTRAMTNLAEQLKGRLLDDMIQHGETQANAGKFRLRRQNGPPRVVVHIDAVELPEEYQYITADKNALRRALRAGETIEGVELEPTEHIRIRVK